MAGTDEAQLGKFGPFTAGLNNKAKPNQGPVDQNGVQVALAEAVNVDLDASGWPRMRRGQLTRVEDPAHSLFPLPEHLLAWVAGSINAYRVEGDGDLTADTTLVTGLGDRLVTYASDDFDVYWSNGAEQGRIDATDLSVHPFWIATPNPVSLAAIANGGLAAGQYDVSVTALDAAGRESAASSPVIVTLTAGQGINVTLPAKPAETAAWRIYVSPPNGDVLYRCVQLPANATSYAIGVHVAGEQLQTAWMSVFPPVTLLRYGHGRLVGSINGVLVWSPPYRLGLTQDTNYLPFGTENTLLEPVGEGGEGAGAGWWVADHKRTYFMASGDPEQWAAAGQIAKYPHPAVPGCSVLAPGTVFGLETTAPVAFWLARNGVFCLGLPGGQVIPMKEESLALPVDAERGTAAVLLFDGIRQILASTFGGLSNLAAATDTADITVRRNGVTT
jgi:hypothetical protein